MSYKVQDFSKLQTKLIDEAWSVFKDGAGKTRALKLETIASHSGKVINDRVYPGAKMKDAVKTLFKSEGGAGFDRPFLRNHDRYSDPIGRIKSAEYKQIASGKKWLNDHFDPSPEGSGFLKVVSHITDQEAIEKFLDGRYQTVSIGGSTDGAFCSICSKTLDTMHPMWSAYKDKDGEEHECRHIPGKMYNDSKAYVITGNLQYHEVSQVSVPADDAATHIAKTIVTQDALEDSLWRFFDAATSIELISTPARFGILDADGNTIMGLDTDTYKSNKTISIPSSTAIENKAEGTKDSGKSTLSDEEFAEAHVLKHFSDLGMLVLTDAQKETVTKLQNVNLSETQSGIVKDTFIIHPCIPFKLYDKFHYQSLRKLIDGGLNVDKERWTKAIEDAATSQSLLGDNNNMDLEAMKKALADAQAKLTALEGDIKTRDAKITDLEKNLTDANAKLKAIDDAKHNTLVSELVALRTELNYHDTRDLKDEAKKEEATKALTAKFGALTDSVLTIMIDDLKAQKAMLGSNTVTDAPVANPLEGGASKEEVKDNKPAEKNETEPKPYELF